VPSSGGEHCGNARGESLFPAIVIPVGRVEKKPVATRLRVQDTIVMETVQPETPQRRRRWYQFRLRTLLIVVALLAIPGSWVAVRMKHQRDVAALRTAGWGVAYDYMVDENGEYLKDDQPPGPAWMRNLLGEGFLSDVAGVHEVCTRTDADLKMLEQFPHLRLLIAGAGDFEAASARGGPITDAGLQHLKALTSLRVLILQHTLITDAGLECLSGLTDLQELSLCGNQGITDAGLEHLKGFKQLRELNLLCTEVTDEGVKRLQQALPDCEIDR
jgi:hypothetical protein